MRNLLVSTLLLATVAACDDDNNEGDIDAANALGEELGEEFADQVDVELRDETPERVAAESGEIMLTIDEAEIAQAELALDFALDPEVIAYATRMIAEHTAHAAQTEAILDSLALDPVDNIVAEELRLDNAENLDELTRRGLDDDVEDFEIEYMRLQVQMHAQSAIIVGALADFAPFEALQRFFDDTVLILDDHRIVAEEILRDL